MWTLLETFMADTRGSVVLDWIALGGVVLILGVMLQVTVNQLQLKALGHRIFEPVRALQLSPGQLQDIGVNGRILVNAN